MGFGKFASGDIRRVLQGGPVGVQPVIGPYDHGLSGGSSREDLEAMFQLIHLTMTEPRRDPTIFSALQSQMRTALAGQTDHPTMHSAGAGTRALAGSSEVARAGGRIDRSDGPRQVLAFYRQRFGNAAGFTFVVRRQLYGGFDSSARGALSGVPAVHRPAGTWKDNGIRPPRGVIERVWRRGLEPKSRTVLVFTGPMEANREQAIAITAMADVLQTRLRDAIREELAPPTTSRQAPAPRACRWGSIPFD
jgi:zinc protease